MKEKISIKTKEELKLLKKGGAILAKALKEASRKALEAEKGQVISAFELEEIAREVIYSQGARPSFLNYSVEENKRYPAALCVSINDEIVHGLPTKKKKIKKGDLLKLDLGVEYKGLYTDAAITLAIGKVSKRASRLLEVCRECLFAGIKELGPGKKLDSFGERVEKITHQSNFSVVEGLVGHGVGYAVHEPPQIFNQSGPRSGVVLKPGMVLALEPMISAGSGQIKLGQDGFVFKTLDGSLAAHFEHTVAITEEGCEILTQEN